MILYFIIKYSLEQFKYENKTLVLLPGSFKPPHKGHWQMVLDNLPIYAGNYKDTLVNGDSTALRE